MDMRTHRQIRVLFVLSTSNAGGGAAQVWMNLLRGLPELGVEPVVIVPNNRAGSLTAKIKNLGIPCYELFYTWWVTTDANPHSLKRKFARRGARYANALAERSIARIITSEHVDLVYICDGTITTGLDAAWQAGIPAVWHFHQYIRGVQDGLSFIDSDAEVARQLKRAARVITVTDGQRADLCMRFGLDEERVQAVFNGIDAKRAAERLSVLEGDDVVFTLAGRIDTNKRQVDAVEAFDMIAADFPGARLVFAGGGAEQDEAALRERASCSPYAQRIELCGFVSDMRTMWERTDVALNCSLSEGCSMVVAEAMTSGCLVIASDAQGNAELLDPDARINGMRRGVHGLLYRRGDAAGLATQMRWALEHREAARVIAAQGRMDGRQAFSLGSQLEQIRSVFDGVLFADEAAGLNASVPIHDALVSVIVPVYNAADSLARCLESLQAQTHENLQIVLVDDGSTDATPQLCDEAADKDSRITAVHQLNGGPPAARNAGLDAACGAWVMFVDADDKVEPDYIERMLVVAANTQADLVVSDCKIAENGKLRRFGMIVPGKTYNSREELWEDFLSDHVPWSLWAKLYRSELFEGVRFDVHDYIAEDLDANARIFAREGLKLATTACAGYTYNVGDGSVDHSFTERHLCQFDIFERVVKLVEREGIETSASAEAFYEERVLNCLRKAIAAHALTPQVTSAFKRAIALHRSDVLKDPNASAGLKLRMRATCLGPRAYAVLNRIYTRK